MDLKDFVYVRDNVFSKEFCEELIKDFESKPERLNAGRSGAGVNLEIKHSLDLNLMGFPELEEKYVDVIFSGFNDTVYEFMYSLPYQNRFEPYHFMFNNNSTSYDACQMQKYLKGQGHYNAYHFEADQLSTTKRQFVFILYLNDVEKGGETELLYGLHKTKPKQGSVLVHPAAFPFVHKGHVPESDDKYIVTTWLSFS
jgi:hypothetical protein